MYRVSKNGRALIAKHEGEVLHVYLDPIGIKTGGRGHTGPDVDALPVGTKITKKQSDAWFDKDVEEVEEIINRHVKVDNLPQDCVDSVASFVFNVGPGKKGVKDGFVTLKSGKQSTMLRKINEGDWEGAAAEFPKWNKAGGKVFKGLIRRRAEEQALFLRGLSEDEEFMEPNIEADHEKQPDTAMKNPAVQATGVAGVAGLMNEAAKQIQPVADKAEYVTYVFVAIVIFALIYAIKAKKKEG